MFQFHHGVFSKTVNGHDLLKSFCQFSFSIFQFGLKFCIFYALDLQHGFCMSTFLCAWCPLLLHHPSTYLYLPLPIHPCFAEQRYSFQAQEAFKMCSIHLNIPEARLLTTTHVSCLSLHPLQDLEAQRCYQWAQGQVEFVKPA